VETIVTNHLYMWPQIVSFETIQNYRCVKTPAGRLCCGGTPLFLWRIM